MPGYTSIIAPADLNSVMYPEIQDTITRGDSTLAQEAIDTAISEAKMYLTRYDIIKLFGSADPDVDSPASFTDPFLTRIVKNIAMWHLLQLANPNISYESAKLLYEQAIDTLKRIQKGLADPKWPYQDTTGETAPQSDQVTIILPSNDKGVFY